MMEKRVYGVLGISSEMANWNADFSGYPKTTSDGLTFGSDKAFKYPIKKMWDNEGKKVVYIKSMKFNDGGKGAISLIPRTLKERYEQVFGVEDLKKDLDARKILANLFQAIDVKNFGATFAESDCNLSITGAVQIGQGMNKYPDTFPQEQSILSPFRDALAKEKSKEKNKKKDDKEDTENEGTEAKNSTLGTKIVSNEAHYFYPFTVNPLAYKDYIEIGVTEGYTEGDYEEFKRASMVAATAYATNAKSGCDNEFALFIETSPNAYLPNLADYITFEKGQDGEKNVISLGAIPDILKKMGSTIRSVEVYYNEHTTKLENATEGISCFDIVTKARL